METLFGRAARALKFTAWEMELLVGSLLGDGTLLKTSAGYCFRVHHGLRQQPLVNWKYRALRRFVRTPPRVSGNGYYFRTVSHPHLLELRAAFYKDARKVVPISLLERYLSPFALAVWIMDDGAADGAQLRLNTQSFTAGENVALRLLLRRKFGLEMTINHDKGRPRLRCRAASMARLLEPVCENVLPEMRYKLAGRPANLVF